VTDFLHPDDPSKLSWLRVAVLVGLALMLWRAYK